MLNNTTTYTATMEGQNVTLTVTWNPENLLVNSQNITGSTGNSTIIIKSDKSNERI